MFQVVNFINWEFGYENYFCQRHSRNVLVRPIFWFIRLITWKTYLKDLSDKHLCCWRLILICCGYVSFIFCYIIKKIKIQLCEFVYILNNLHSRLQTFIYVLTLYSLCFFVVVVAILLMQPSPKLELSQFVRFLNDVCIIILPACDCHYLHVAMFFCSFFNITFYRIWNSSCDICFLLYLIKLIDFFILANSL